jgi:hypothetical protein
MQKKTRIQEIAKKESKKWKSPKCARHLGHDDSHHATMGKLRNQGNQRKYILF